MSGRCPKSVELCLSWLWLDGGRTLLLLLAEVHWHYSAADHRQCGRTLHGYQGPGVALLHSGMTSHALQKHVCQVAMQNKMDLSLGVATSGCFESSLSAISTSDLVSHKGSCRVILPDGSTCAHLSHDISRGLWIVGGCNLRSDCLSACKSWARRVCTR